MAVLRDSDITLEQSGIRPKWAVRGYAKRLLRLKQGSEYLGLSRWTFRRLVHEGQIPILKTHHNAPWLVDLRDLDAWVEKNKQKR
jgi:excisionase family DNA binding protein